MALGFSLIELVVTMAVALVLISIAIPSFRTLTQNSRLAAQVNDLVADLNYARSEAIKRRTTVSVCTSADGATCSVGNWAGGRIIYYLPGPIVLRYRGALDVATDTLTSTGPNPLNFDSRGATPVAMTFTFCDGRGASYGKLIIVNSIGQPTLDRASPPASCL